MYISECLSWCLCRYLEVEWEVKKGSKRSFGKDVMKGSSPRVPQQDNFSDCGVYVLQYVESFFEVRGLMGTVYLIVDWTTYSGSPRIESERFSKNSFLIFYTFVHTDPRHPGKDEWHCSKSNRLFRSHFSFWTNSKGHCTRSPKFSSEIKNQTK